MPFTPIKGKKSQVRQVNIPFDNEMLQDLDKLAKKFGLSRPQLIVQMCDYCLYEDNAEVVDPAPIPNGGDDETLDPAFDD